MQTFKEGDTVSVLHELINGTVKKVYSNQIQIEDEFGFDRLFTPDQLAKRVDVSDYKMGKDIRPKDEMTIQKSVPSKAKATRVSITYKTEIDLHIEELVDSHRHLANFQIVQIQMTACRAFIQDAIANNLKKIFIIHGKGEGVLKSEIHQYLDRLSNRSGIQLDYSDASYQKYGRDGATEVRF